MKVGIIAPLSIAAVNGGVRTQATQTASHLQKLGIEVEYISPWTNELKVDLVHIFLAGSGVLGITKRMKELSIPVVLSPVFFANRSAGVIAVALKAEKALSIVGSGIRSEFGIKAEVCQHSRLILPNTLQEALLIEEGLGIDAEKIIVVPNGVESRFKEADPKLFIETYQKKDFVLFVGQAGAPRKNVLALLKAAPDINSELVIIGSFYDDEYGYECKDLASATGNVLLLDPVDHDSDLLASAYAACHTFVLPSQFETPGIAAMEAALTGANIAITRKGGTHDYFRELAFYLDPGSVSSVSDAINNSLSKPKSNKLRDRILAEYTWDKVAEKTLEAYKLIV